MLKWFKPTWMVDSIYSITPEQLEKNNIKAVLTDLDNTLIAWNDPKASDDAVQWINRMNLAKVPVVILSNNSDARVKEVANYLNVDYIPRSMKPSRRAFRLAEEKLQMPLEDMLMVGDQVITDVFGSNRAGVRSVLVKPILELDAWNTKFNRFIELKIMNYLIKSDPKMRWGETLDEPISK